MLYRDLKDYLNIFTFLTLYFSFIGTVTEKHLKNLNSGNVNLI